MSWLEGFPYLVNQARVVGRECCHQDAEARYCFCWKCTLCAYNDGRSSLVAGTRDSSAWHGACAPRQLNVKTTCRGAIGASRARFRSVSSSLQCAFPAVVRALHLLAAPPVVPVSPRWSLLHVSLVAAEHEWDERIEGASTRASTWPLHRCSQLVKCAVLSTRPHELDERVKADHMPQVTKCGVLCTTFCSNRRCLSLSSKPSEVRRNKMVMLRRSAQNHHDARSLGVLSSRLTRAAHSRTSPRLTRTDLHVTRRANAAAGANG